MSIRVYRVYEKDIAKADVTRPSQAFMKALQDTGAPVIDMFGIYKIANGYAVHCTRHPLKGYYEIAVWPEAHDIPGPEPLEPRSYGTHSLILLGICIMAIAIRIYLG